MMSEQLSWYPYGLQLFVAVKHLWLLQSSSLGHTFLSNRTTAKVEIIVDKWSLGGTFCDMVALRVCGSANASRLKKPVFNCGKVQIAYFPPQQPLSFPWEAQAKLKEWRVWSTLTDRTDQKFVEDRVDTVISPWKKRYFSVGNEIKIALHDFQWPMASWATTTQLMLTSRPIRSINWVCLVESLPTNFSFLIQHALFLNKCIQWIRRDYENFPRARLLNVDESAL